MLSLVPTPIGNLEDITLRALSVLREADIIAAEDTRHTGILLRHFDIAKPLLSFHEHNEARRTSELIERLEQGSHVALVSDAGSPSISDPGARLIRACIARGVAYTILPGPCAAITALIGSGFDTARFYFGGFLPVKSGQRQAELDRALSREETSVYYESPHRILKSLAAIAAARPAALVCVARELTKKFEEFRIGAAGDLVSHYTQHPPKGEICLLIGRGGGATLAPAASGAASIA